MSHLLLAILSAPIITGCSTVNVTESKSFTSAPAPRPAMIYVADFEASAITNEMTSSASTNAPGAVCPEKLCAKLADLMAESLVKDLNKAGYEAVRIGPETPPASEGWLVRGSFTAAEDISKRFADAIPEERIRSTVESLFKKLGEEHAWITRLFARLLADPDGRTAGLGGAGVREIFLAATGGHQKAAQSTG
jgi:hypothetical protein